MNSNNMVSTGKARKEIMISASSNIKIVRISVSAIIMQDFMIMPKAIENPTNPCLYSFLTGLKKVFRHTAKPNN
jgi:hypothetical protein